MARPRGTFKYSLDESVFDRITVESLYWMGYIAGDGNIRTKCDGQHQISITSKDKDILEKFLSFVNTARPLRYNRGTYSITISSQRMVDRLSEFGIRENKSTTISVEGGVNEHLSFWHGYFDANGSVGVYSTGTPYPQFSIASGSRGLCRQFFDFWKLRGYEFRFTFVKNGRGCGCVISGKRVIRFLAEYFSERPKMISLDRKQEKINNIISEYGEWAGVSL